MINNLNQTLVIASGNSGKLREFDALLAPLNWTIKAQQELGVDDAEETGLSFVENAILKARHAATITGHPALADDSGLEVDALDGAPGIYSARYAAMNGRAAGDESNNLLLLENLSNVPEHERTARFRAVIAFLRHAADPSPIIAEGSWEGRILFEPAGAGGFGYDPLFYALDAGCSAAELAKDKKNSLSHRGQALRQLLDRMQLQRG